MPPVPLLTTSPTSAEVARKAGVSRTTVSFVLNDVRDRGISEATRARVLAAADELGYRPNIAARMLAGGASATVGLVMPQAAHLYDDVFLAHLVGSINEACHRAGLKMLIESTDGEGREPGGFVDLVRSRRIDGLIVVNLRRSEHAHLRQIAAAGIPLVVLGSGRDGTGDFHTLGTDNHHGATLAVDHLLDLGHRCIAHVGFAPSEFHSVCERERGWRDALAARGITPAPSWVAQADISAESGWRATRELLARGVPFTALFVGNDTVAFGALRALREAGRRVPDDVAVVGYDDLPLAPFAAPPLTSIRTDPAAHGREAMDMLLALMAGQGGAATHRDIGAALVVRASCGAGQRGLR
jgi:DNA-binding LacI/PurR family transcriptional regulator